MSGKGSETAAFYPNSPPTAGTLARLGREPHDGHQLRGGAGGACPVLGPAAAPRRALVRAAAAPQVPVPGGRQRHLRRLRTRPCGQGTRNEAYFY